MVTAALFSHTARPSGAELFMARIASAMRVVRPIVVLGEHGPLEELLAERGIPTRVLPMSKAANGGGGGTRLAAPLRAWGYAQALGKLLRDEGVDVLYTHSMQAHLLGGIAGRLARIPVVSHAHDLLAPPVRRRLPAAVGRLIFAGLPTVRVANSRITQQSAGWASRLPWEIVPCPVELPLVRPVPDQARQYGRTSVLVLGRLANLKGQDLAIRAIAAIASTGRSVELDLVGDAQFAGDFSYQRELEALATDLGVAELVHFHGHTDDPGSAIRRTDLVVLSSTVPEGFGQVVLEAMAESKSVVLPDSAGVMEQLESSGDCIVYPMGDVGALAIAIARLVDKPDERRRIGRAARVTAEGFAPDRVVPGIERILCAAAVTRAARETIKPTELVPMFHQRSGVRESSLRRNTEIGILK